MKAGASGGRCGSRRGAAAAACALVFGLLGVAVGPVAAETAPAVRSGINLDYMDPAVSPRSDLFRHANGRWLRDTAVPSDRAMFGIDAITQERTEQQLRELVEDLAAQPDLAPATTAGKIAILYRDFMDEARCNQLGLTPLQDLLDSITAARTRADLAPLFGRFAQLGITTPLDIGVAQDERQADRYLIHVAQSGLSLPDRDYYLDRKDSRFRTVRTAFLRHLEAQFRRLQDPAPADAAQAVLALETRIAGIAWTRVQNRDPQRTYNPRSLVQLRAMMPRFDWSGFLVAGGFPSDPGTVVVGQPDYFRRLDAVLTRTPLPTLKRWLRWQVLRAHAPLLDAQTARDSFQFESGVLQGIPEERPRWKRGLAVLEGAIGEGLGERYVARHFPPEAKARIQDLVGHLIDAYADSITHLDWLDERTRSAADAKLHRIRSKLAYPDHWRDYAGLDFTPGDLVGNVQRAQLFETRRHIARLGQTVDRDEWIMTPQTVNAYYNPTLNEIVFPAAQLQAPYFDPAADDAANYGDIGFIIGHELSHAFDDEGSQFDGDGNLRDWWTAADHDRFKARTRALVAQYDAIEALPGLHVNGALTLGENIADNAGLAIAWKAYQAALGGKAAPVIDGMTGAQRFFVAYAQSWMGKQREADLIKQIKTDPHAPLDARTNFAVRNQDAFHQAFGTQPGDPLWLDPAQRVRLW